MPSIKLPALLREMHALRKEGALAVMAQGLAVGGGSGAVIGCFRLLYDLASARIATTLKKTPPDVFPAGFAVFGALLVLSIIVGFMVKKTPLISGSGIPHARIGAADCGAVFSGGRERRKNADRCGKGTEYARGVPARAGKGAERAARCEREKRQMIW